MQRATIYKTFLLLALILTTGTYNKCSAAASSDRRITKKEICASIDRFDQKITTRIYEKCMQWQKTYRQQEAEQAYTDAFMQLTKNLMCQLAQQKNTDFFRTIQHLPLTRISLEDGRSIMVPPKRIITLDCLTSYIQLVKPAYIVYFLPQFNACIVTIIQKEIESRSASSSK